MDYKSLGCYNRHRQAHPRNQSPPLESTAGALADLPQQLLPASMSWWLEGTCYIRPPACLSTSARRLAVLHPAASLCYIRPPAFLQTTSPMCYPATTVGQQRCYWRPVEVLLKGGGAATRVLDTGEVSHRSWQAGVVVWVVWAVVVLIGVLWCVLLQFRFNFASLEYMFCYDYSSDLHSKSCWKMFAGFLSPMLH
jgi:hypothetical protein